MSKLDIRKTLGSDFTIADVESILEDLWDRGQELPNEIVCTAAQKRRFAALDKEPTILRRIQRIEETLGLKPIDTVYDFDFGEIKIRAEK